MYSINKIKGNLKDIIRILVRDFSIKYLGLPLTTGRLKHNECNGLISSMEKNSFKAIGEEIIICRQSINAILGV